MAMEIELVKFSCQHWRPRPPGWSDGRVTANPFTIQGKLDEVAEALGTPFFESSMIGDLKVRQPVVLCPACDAELRAELGLPGRAPVPAAGPLSD